MTDRPLTTDEINATFDARERVELAAEERRLRDESPADFPHRGGHDNPCAYAAGMGPRCTCPVSS